jgi:tRNA-Thr(GGU) m(6)t(6)A37 methyltransferase TsaA
MSGHTSPRSIMVGTNGPGSPWGADVNWLGYRLGTKWTVTSTRRSVKASVVDYRLRPIGVIRSPLTALRHAPRQGSEGAPDAWLEVQPWASEGLRGLAVGDKVLILTWLHRGRRNVRQVHPRGDKRRRLTGVFATRSPDRPNPLGLHPVTVRAIDGHRLRIGPIEAIDGTPVVDIKPVLR